MEKRKMGAHCHCGLAGIMELPHCSAMWWQHSRSAGVIVAPGRTHAMAGVIAHNKAIVSSANARVLVTLISVLHFLAAMNKFSLQRTMLV